MLITVPTSELTKRWIHYTCYVFDGECTCNDGCVQNVFALNDRDLETMILRTHEVDGLYVPSIQNCAKKILSCMITYDTNGRDYFVTAELGNRFKHQFPTRNAKPVKIKKHHTCLSSVVNEVWRQQQKQITSVKSPNKEIYHQLSHYPINSYPAHNEWFQMDGLRTMSIEQMYEIFDVHLHYVIDLKFIRIVHIEQVSDMMEDKILSKYK